MGMTMTQKILAAHAGLDSVVAGQLISAKLDIVLGNDIGAGRDEAAKRHALLRFVIIINIDGGLFAKSYALCKSGKNKIVHAAMTCVNTVILIFLPEGMLILVAITCEIIGMVHPVAFNMLCLTFKID